MSDNTNEEIEIDLMEIFYLLKSRAVIIIALAVIAAIGTFCVSKFCLTEQFASTSKLYVLSKSTSITSIADLQIGTSLTTDYMELINSRPVVEKVIENLGLDKEPYSETYESLLPKIAVENPTDTRILAITVTYTSPEMAKKIVDEIAKVAQTSISKVMAQDEPNIIEKGYANPIKIAPSNVKNAAIGGIIMFVLVCGFFIVRFIMDDTIKSSEDIEKYLGINTLATIPYKEETVDEN
ncbi:MAG: polysaccharide export protein [Eubacterium sp.]|nr:polysaccharide export protein [Eubacterium sp.]